jgi:Uma2 family endonuclease
MSILHAPVDECAQAPDEQRFLLRAVDWQTYHAISEALTGRHLRLAYDRGRLELMTISRSHGNYARLLGRFVFVLAEEFRLPISSCGDMTCNRQDLDRALELDECFYLPHEPLIRDKEVIDLSVDPPPDLGVEIEITRSFVNRLSICEALGIPEIWRFNGETVLAYHRGNDGQYLESDRSLHFPFLVVQEMLAFLHKRAEMDETSLVRLFRDWVREQVAKPSLASPKTAEDRPKKTNSKKQGNGKRKKR